MAEDFWPLRVVDDLRRSHRSEVVTNELLASVGSHVIRGVLADRFVCECPNVTPHPLDVRFHLDDSSRFGTNCTVFKAYWAPHTHEVEFRGGPKHGLVMSLAHLGGEFRFPVIRARPFVFSDPRLEVEPSYDVVTYRLAGWANGARRWVFTPAT